MTQTFSNARKCLRCGWEWIRKPKDAHQVKADENEPKRCPRCRTEKWNTEAEKVYQGAK